MSEFKGTPGPWVNVGGWVDAENPRRITICKMGQIIKETTEQVQDYNASLIASAPELLEALKAALGWIDAVPQDVQLPTMPGFDRDWVDGIIAKALGRSL